MQSLDLQATMSSSLLIRCLIVPSFYLLAISITLTSSVRVTSVDSNNRMSMPQTFDRIKRVPLLMCVEGSEVCMSDGAIPYEYKLMKARKKDIKEISRLCVDTFLGEGDDWLHISREAQRVARDISNRWGATNTSFLIVEASEKQTRPTSQVVKSMIVGFVEVASTREHCFVLAADVPFREYRAKVTSLVVNSAHRRKGIATLLLAACAKQSRLWSDHSELFLEVRNDNEGARQFYDKMGFRECFGAKSLVDKTDANIALYILKNLSYD